MFAKLKQRVWEVVEVARPGDRLSRVFDVSILSLIALNVLAVILGTVQEIHDQYGLFLKNFEIISVAVFTAEYLLRIWACPVAYPELGAFRARLKFIRSPLALIDLLAILPFFLPLLHGDLRSVRIFRLLRILRLAKAGRYTKSLRLIHEVFQQKKEELLLALTLMTFLLIVSASLLYACEHEVQPDKFSSIPASMWWSVSTLTTVGYGDMYPITFPGRFFAGLISLIGVGMFALPTGILGAGFVELCHDRKEREALICPHCGKAVE